MCVCKGNAGNLVESYSQRARREDHERQLVTQLDPLGRHLPSQHIAQVWHKVHTVHIYL